MRDQEIDLACLTEEGEDLQPMRLRYGVTTDEASHHEPLEMSLNQEEAELSAAEDGAWDDVEPEDRGVVRTRSSQLPDDVDEERVSPAAESDAMHVIDA